MCVHTHIIHYTGPCTSEGGESGCPGKILLGFAGGARNPLGLMKYVRPPFILVPPTFAQKL